MNKIKDYVKLSYDELMNKVTWPTWGELQESTIIVMIAALLIAFIIFIMDLISNGGLGFFYQMFK
jgi:preprotein translocase subunit SecE